MPDLHLRSLMLTLWQSACQDTPQRPSCTVQDGAFIFTITGNRSQWTDLCTAAAVPPHAEQRIAGATLTCRWPSHADQIFGAAGQLAQHFGPGYEVRLPQLHMARLIQRAIEMNAPAVVEAGTGVGKSFAYAAIALAMRKRLIISTSNKALQLQLYTKDLPFLAQLFPERTVALAVGKGNYACRVKCEERTAGGDRTLAIADPDLRQWYLETRTGNLEEIPFAIQWQDQAKLAVDDDCAGKYCPLFYDCFYYAAKAEREAADVVITNHMLLCLHQLYPAAHILPTADVLVVDEAHKLPDYARTALGAELTLAQVAKALDQAEPYVDSVDLLDDTRATAASVATAWDVAILAAQDDRGRTPPQVALHQEFPACSTLADQLDTIAAQVWRAEELPNDASEKKQARRAARLRSLADKFAALAMPTTAGFVRWLEPNNGQTKAVNTPYDVANFVGALAGAGEAETTPTVQTTDRTRCARCGRPLTTEQVAVLAGRAYGPDCIQYVDLFGDAETMQRAAWLALQPPTPPAPATAPTSCPPVVFCSATLAAPDLAHFLRTAGLAANQVLTMQAPSPFDYGNHALLFVPNGASPAPNERGWQEWLVAQLTDLVQASQGGAFLLFTSFAAMNYAVTALQPDLARRYQVLVQGTMPKPEIVRRFKADGNAVLFATKSFFEGVSIDGAALRLVVVDKLPFEAPSPLTTAMEAAAQQYARQELRLSAQAAENYPFNAVRLPHMILELKQAAGRLIRTQTDRGVIAVLDVRMRSTQYGRRQVLPALPPAPLTAQLLAVQEFYRPHPTPPPSLTVATTVVNDWTLEELP